MLDPSDPQEEQQRLERLLTAARDITPAVTGVVARGSDVEIEDDGEREGLCG